MRFVTKIMVLGAVVGLIGWTTAGTARAEENPAGNKWKVQIETGLGIAQAAYSDNWTGGEAGSIIWASVFRGKADKQLSAIWFWGNELKLAFGQTHSQDKESKEWAEPQKSTDKVRYDGIVRLTHGWAVDPYGAGTVETQFLDASTDRHLYFNPVDLTETAGVARDLIKVPDKRVLTTRFGAGFRQKMVHNVETTNDGGLEWVTDLALGSAKSKYSFVSKLSVFQALFTSKKYEDSDPTKDYWQTTDLNWDNTLSANVTSILQVSLAWQLLYDKEIDLGGRFKEALTLGLTYKFANFEVEEKK